MTNQTNGAAGVENDPVELIRTMVAELSRLATPQPTRSDVSANQIRMQVRYTALRNGLGNHAMHSQSVVNTLVTPSPVLDRKGLLSFPGGVPYGTETIIAYDQNGSEVETVSRTHASAIVGHGAIAWIELVDAADTPFMLGIPIRTA